MWLFAMRILLSSLFTRLILGNYFHVMLLVVAFCFHVQYYSDYYSTITIIFSMILVITMIVVTIVPIIVVVIVVGGRQIMASTIIIVFIITSVISTVVIMMIFLSRLNITRDDKENKNNCSNGCDGSCGFGQCPHSQAWQ